MRGSNGANILSVAEGVLTRCTQQANLGRTVIMRRGVPTGNSVAVCWGKKVAPLFRRRGRGTTSGAYTLKYFHSLGEGGKSVGRVQRILSAAWFPAARDYVGGGLP